MFWIVALTTLGVVFGTLIWRRVANNHLNDTIRFYEHNFGFGEAYTGFSNVIFGGIFGFIFGLLVASTLNPSETKVVTLEYNLGSLRDSGTTGTFFLGIGDIEDGAYYRYYLMNPDGSYKLKTLWSENDQVTVVQENRADAMLRIKYRHTRTLKPENTLWTLRQADSWQPFSWTFHVPQGTIQQTFSLH